MTNYALAVFDPAVPLPKLDRWHWRRRFKCPDPTCAHERTRAGQRGRRVIGWQQIRKWTHAAGSVAPGAPSVAPVSGYLIEKVWLAQGLTSLPDLPDGALSFGLPEGARNDPGTTSRARAIPVLASAGPTPFGPASGDPYRSRRGRSWPRARRHRLLGPRPHTPESSATVRRDVPRLWASLSGGQRPA